MEKVAVQNTKPGVENAPQDTGDQLTISERILGRKRGRPQGSKTKNRNLDTSPAAQNVQLVSDVERELAKEAIKGLLNCGDMVVIEYFASKVYDLTRDTKLSDEIRGSVRMLDIEKDAISGGIVAELVKRKLLHLTSSIILLGAVCSYLSRLALAGSRISKFKKTAEYAAKSSTDKNISDREVGQRQDNVLV